MCILCGFLEARIFVFSSTQRRHLHENGQNCGFAAATGVELEPVLQLAARTALAPPAHPLLTPKSARDINFSPPGSGGSLRVPAQRRRSRADVAGFPPTPPPCSDTSLSGIHAASIPYGRITERTAKQCATILLVLCYTENVDAGYFRGGES